MNMINEEADDNWILKRDAVIGEKPKVMSVNIPKLVLPASKLDSRREALDKVSNMTHTRRDKLLREMLMS